MLGDYFCYAKTWGLCTSNQIFLQLLKEVPSGSEVECSFFFYVAVPWQ